MQLTTYLTKDNYIRAGLVAIGLVLLVIAGTKLPGHHARSWFGSEPVVERVEKPVKVVKPAQVVKKAKRVKRAARKTVAKPVAPPAAPEQPHGWTRVCGNDNWCNWVYYP